MKIAYIIFDGITWLDFIGIYDPIARLQSQKHLEDISWDVCALGETAIDSFSLKIMADKVEPDLSVYDMIVIPGGFGTRDLQFDPDFMDWIATAESVPYKVSICTGSLILGAAGFLKDKHATTHFDEYGNLKEYAKVVHKNRIVKDGKTITAGAVASSLDLGLFICELLAGKEAREKIQATMDYHPGVEDIKFIEN